MRGRTVVLGVGLIGCVLLASACRPMALATPASWLELACSEPAALVYVDERAVGPAVSLRAPLRLGAGVHRVEVRAPGKLDVYREVLLRAGERTRLQIVLHPDLDAEDAADDTPQGGERDRFPAPPLSRAMLGERPHSRS